MSVLSLTVLSGSPNISASLNTVLPDYDTATLNTVLSLFIQFGSGEWSIYPQTPETAGHTTLTVWQWCKGSAINLCVCVYDSK